MSISSEKVDCEVAKGVLTRRLPETGLLIRYREALREPICSILKNHHRFVCICVKLFSRTFAQLDKDESINAPEHAQSGPILQFFRIRQRKGYLLWDGSNYINPEIDQPDNNL